MRHKTTEHIRLSCSACLSMAHSAAEVFPKETMGGLVAAKKNPDFILAAVPYQSARRQYTGVSSYSSGMFATVVRGAWFKFGDYHSHPYGAEDALVFLAPSEEDLKYMGVGEVEFIIRIYKTRKNAFRFHATKGGAISGSLGRYRVLIKAFRKEKGVDSSGVPRYKTLRVSLAGRG